MKFKPNLITIIKITFLQLALMLLMIGSAVANDRGAQVMLKTKVSLSERNVPLKTVIKDMESRYHINFVFSQALIKSNQKISTSFTAKPLEAVLSAVFEPLNMAYQASGDVIVISAVKPETNQRKAGLDISVSPITGRVLDDKGGPAVGINVVIKGTKTGTVTDANGNFSINASPGATLIFSSVGFDPLELPATAEPMKVILKSSSSALTEIVVVGATFKKGDLTGSVSNVDSKTLQDRPVTNVNSALQGRVAGVFIGGGSKPSDDAVIKIRGTNTINSGSTPIYVVDGLIMENNLGGFNSINMNDVASVAILKDASATALYGSRGANGVVVITTKKGKKTGGDGTISYDGWAGFSNIAKMPETMNAGQLFQLRLDAYANGYLKDNPNANRQDYINNTLLKTNVAFSQQEFNTYNSGKTYNWLDQIKQTGYQQNHALSFTGGTDKSSFYLSLGYAGNSGIIQQVNQNKYTGRFNADYSVKKWLKIGTNTGYTRTDDRQVDDDVYNQALNANPLLDYAPYQADDTRYTANYLTIYYRALGQNSNNNFNPFNAMEIVRRQNRNRLVTSNFINVNPIPGLDIRSTFSVDYGQQSYFTFTPNNIQEAIRNYNGDARAKAERWNDLYWQWDNTATYSRTFQGKHRITALLGTSASKHTSDYTLAQGDRFASNDLSYFNLGGAAAQDKTTIGSNFYAYSMFSVIARFTYSYDNKYYVTATARDDGSSRFAPGHQYGIFPSGSVRWEISKEDFLKNQKVFNQLSLRAGYGVVGNQDITNYAFQTLYGSKVNNNNALLANDGLKGNPDLTWERQKQANLGLDMAFLNNRLSATAEAFYINNDNLLLDRGLALTTGYSHQLQNIGRVNNKGIELSLSGQIIKNSDWNWTVAGNISFAKNAVKQLYGNATVIYSSSGDSRENNLFVGQPLHSIYTLRSGGIAQESNRSEWQGLNYNGKTVGLGDLFALDVSGPNGVKDGIVNQYDRVIVGKEDPKYYGGFSTNLTYKGLDLNAVFVYSHGAKKISSYYEGLINSVGSSMASVDLLNRWTPTNTDTNIPKVIDNTSYNRFAPSDLDYAVQDASYLRLSALTLGYNLSQKLLDSWHASRVRIYATGSNLFLITKYKGLDPETGDYGYPPVRTFVVGVNFGF